jgi:hypothetical protein
MSGSTEGVATTQIPHNAKKADSVRHTHTHSTKNSIRPALPSDTIGRETKR